jgi:DNA-binding transcriptional MerR regulator
MRGMDASYTVGRLAIAAGVPTTTVRYYERRGLLQPALRLGSGSYRTYGEPELERLRFIRSAQRYDRKLWIVEPVTPAAYPPP